MKFVHTSKENPLFAFSPYDGIENQGKVKFSRLVVTLQLEALLSIFKFQDRLMEKLPKDDTPNEQVKKKEVLKKNASPSLRINAVLEEFRVILASKQTRLFDIQVQGLNRNVFESFGRTFLQVSKGMFLNHQISSQCV